MAGALEGANQFVGAFNDPQALAQREREQQAQQQVASFAAGQGLVAPGQQEAFGQLGTQSQQALLGQVGTQRREERLAGQFQQTEARLAEQGKAAAKDKTLSNILRGLQINKLVGDLEATGDQNKAGRDLKAFTKDLPGSSQVRANALIAKRDFAGASKVIEAAQAKPGSPTDTFDAVARGEIADPLDFDAVEKHIAGRVAERKGSLSKNARRALVTKEITAFRNRFFEDVEVPGRFFGTNLEPRLKPEFQQQLEALKQPPAEAGTIRFRDPASGQEADIPAANAAAAEQRGLVRVQ